MSSQVRSLIQFRWRLVTGALLFLCPVLPLSADGGTPSPGPSDARSFADLAQPAVRPAGAPLSSDVCFSSRWRRPIDAEDPHDTFRDAARFHATRLDWVYTTDSAWIRECTELGYSIGTALNSKLPDTPGADQRVRGRMRNRGGSLVTAPWMVGWDAWWGCVNSPDYRAIFLEHARRCLDGGALYLHVDDPDMNYRAVEWGACFCSCCREKAAARGIDLTDSLAMREFQRASVTEFYEDVRRALDRYAGRRVPVSCNNYRAVWDVFPYNLFDFGMAELPEADATASTIYRRLSATRGLGKAQILTFVSEDIELTRRVIATSYALGSHTLVPWDVYLKSTPEGSIRYFGRPEDFADLYGFVRAQARFLDGYEEAAVAGFDDNVDVLRPPVSVRQRSGGTVAVVRAKPGDRTAPIVVHLVQWKGTEDSLTVLIDRARLPAHGQLTAALYVPVPALSPKSIVTVSEEDSSRGAQKIHVPLHENGESLRCVLPPLTPWGMLLIEAAQAHDR